MVEGHTAELVVERIFPLIRTCSGHGLSWRNMVFPKGIGHHLKLFRPGYHLVQQTTQRANSFPPSVRALSATKTELF